MKGQGVVSAALVACAAGAMWSIYSGPLKSLILSDPGAKATPVTHTVREHPFHAVVPAFGELQTATATPIAVPNVATGGLKIFFIIKDGTRVRKGDTLVEFDASDLLQQLDETKGNLDATLRQLEATVVRGSTETGQVDSDLTVARLEHDKALHQAPKDEQLFSRVQILEGQMNLDLASTKVREWSAKKDSRQTLGTVSERILEIDRKKHTTKQGTLEKSLGSLKVLAPHDGLVLHQKDQSGMGITVGETRWPGFIMLTIPDLESIRARVMVLESDAGSLRVGQKAEIIVDSNPGQRFPATVSRIETLARSLDKDSPVKYFEVILALTGNNSDVLRPGKLIRAEITIAEYERALTVPRFAVLQEGTQTFVFVGKEKRSVQLETGDRATAVIRSGVRAGESVVLNPGEDRPGPDAETKAVKQPRASQVR